MTRSRATLAMIEAAAIDRLLASPLTSVTPWHGNSLGQALPSIKAVSGQNANPSTARRIAKSDASRMLSASISSTLAQPIATWACAWIRSNKILRLVAYSILESFNPTGIMPRSKITAAAQTGPAKGPRPASSTPAMRPPRASSWTRSGMERGITPHPTAQRGEQDRAARTGPPTKPKGKNPQGRNPASRTQPLFAKHRPA